MIDRLDKLLRDLLVAQISNLSEEQVRFQPPNQEWRTYVVSDLNAIALNIYLVDLRENRKLRSNERIRSEDNGIIKEKPVPARLDSHYLISAWSPVSPAPGIEPTLDEHLLLYQTTAVLMRNNLLTPSRFYPAGSPDLDIWLEFRDTDLPLTVLPPEGFNKLSEFWQNMGQGALWKPALYLIVTLPIELMSAVAGFRVTTRITEYRPTGQPDSAEVRIQQIGGYVLDATNPPDEGSPIPVANAWVRLESSGGEPLQTTTTGELGRFTFENLQPGDYQLRWRAGTRPEPAPRAIAIPSPTGEYNLRFE